MEFFIFHMKTKFLTSFERENLQQANNQTYDCMQCSEHITNPICHDCLGNQVSSWLGLYPSVKKKVQPKIKDYIKEVNNNIINSIGCASCKHEKAALCPYCFTEGIYNLLKKNKIDKMIIMDFLSTFNFDLKHEGYIHEAIEQGLF